jgi:multicomponent Na+:H+ antiporter subunit E
MERILARLLTAAVLVLIYMLWSGIPRGADAVPVAAAAAAVALLFARPSRFPRITPRRLAWSVAYIFYLFAAVVRANLDVAGRIVRRRIPLRPGVVAVRTRLRTRMGRLILANSITLTPGTLSVDIAGDTLFIHWIDVSATDVDGATRAIVSGFERYLEVICG